MFVGRGLAPEEVKRGSFVYWGGGGEAAGRETK